MLSDKQMQDKYIRKGFSEIHWKGSDKKLNHFALIKKLQHEYPEEIKQLIIKIKDNFKAEDIKIIIENIDNNLPVNLKKHKLQDERKELMFKLINLRFNKLIELI